MSYAMFGIESMNDLSLQELAERFEVPIEAFHEEFGVTLLSRRRNSYAFRVEREYADKFKTDPRVRGPYSDGPVSALS